MGLLTFTVKPNIPAPLAPLEELSRNLWISWNYEAILLFMRLDHDAWLASRQSPTRMLGLVPQKRLDEAAADDSFLAALSSVYAKFKRYLAAERWYKGPTDRAIAYFSMEYGIDVSLPVYSGGLGVLSGDHLKTSSDLGLPLVGVGLLYRQGYFQQYLNADGFQQESYPENDWYNMPVALCRAASGEPVTVSVDLAGEKASAWVWEVRVGKCPLYLLDANIEANSAPLRQITASLYGGDRENRIRQEILLGVGGIRALNALGITPAVTHMNEGHSAFLGVERIRGLVKGSKLSFAEALQAVWATSVFTTHTPVPAGNERFAPALVEKYFRSTAQELGLSWKDFLALGRERADDDAEEFCLTVLALRLSAYANGVSRLHGEVSRGMWRRLWPGLPLAEVPIGHVTNGVHPRTWIAHDLVDLLDRYLGPGFHDEPTNLAIWDRLDRVSDEELWRTHERRRERLVAFVRARLREQLVRRGATNSELAVCEDALSPSTLTVCFARRFAAYKRADLLLSDPERLLRLLTDTQRPLQLIFAGKAHPHDLAGKEIIRRVVHFAGDPRVRSRVVFLEDYDMTIARYLVSGSDVWLNTPRRPFEASGTSGMKAAMNGVLNVSILDGWWDEAYDPRLGWAVGRGEQYEDPKLEDSIEGTALYDLLEREVVPQFYTRGIDGLPREWIRGMKASMREVGKRFSCHRMLLEYAERYYLPGLEAQARLAGEGHAAAKALAAYLERVRRSWPGLRVEELSSSSPSILKVGDAISVRAKVNLAGMSPDDVCVELYHGALSSQGEILQPRRLEMRPSGSEGASTVYAADAPADATGRQGYTLRVLPRHPALAHPFLPGLVKWG
ncbi:MAG: alpha-glucan phosphorylase [Spirochaetes bacterium RBG_13_68_11]|nr:MAG: alpha-glucan phosphorylase [Spirochaetes bacterium RBG_13_68_11]